MTLFFDLRRRFPRFEAAKRAVFQLRGLRGIAPRFAKHVAVSKIKTMRQPARQFPRARGEEQHALAVAHDRVQRLGETRAPFYVEADQRLVEHQQFRRQ